MKKLIGILILSITFVVNSTFVSAQAEKKPTIAVLNIRNANQGDETRSHGLGVAGILTTGLVNTGRFKVIERIDLRQILIEHKMGIDGIFDASTIKSLGKISAVEYVVMGSITRFTNLFEIDVRVLDTETGEIVSAEFGTCTDDKNIRDTIETVASKIAKDWQASREKKEKRIAVFCFDDGSGGKLIGDTIAEMLTTYLVKNSFFKIIERANLDKILKEQKLTISGIVSGGTAKKVGRLLGVDAIILGDATEFGDTITVDTRIVNIETGEVEKSEGIQIPDPVSARTQVFKLGRKILDLSSPKVCELSDIEIKRGESWIKQFRSTSAKGYVSTIDFGIKVEECTFDNEGYAIQYVPVKYHICTIEIKVDGNEKLRKEFGLNYDYDNKFSYWGKYKYGSTGIFELSKTYTFYPFKFEFVIRADISEKRVSKESYAHGHPYGTGEWYIYEIRIKHLEINRLDY